MKHRASAALLAMLFTGTVLAVLAPTRNIFFEFCTTKAYGWPVPWKVEYCPCARGMTVHPPPAFAVYASLLLGSALAGAFFPEWRPFRRPRRRLR